MKFSKLINSLPAVSTSMIAVVVLNLLPVVGLCFFHWSPFDVVFFFWVESVAIGAGCVFKMLFTPHALSVWKRLSSSAFFCFHYGAFTLAHGLFVFMLMDEGIQQYREQDGDVVPFAFIFQRLLVLVIENQWILAQVCVVQAVLVLRAYQKAQIAPPDEEMMKPYGRVVLMHIVVTLGALLSYAFTNVGAVFMLTLVVLKLIAEIDAQKTLDKRGGVL